MITHKNNKNQKNVHNQATPLSSLSHPSSSKLKNIPHCTVKFTKVKTNDDDDDENDDDEVVAKASTGTASAKSLHFAKPLQTYGTNSSTTTSKVSRLRAIGHQIR